MKLIQIGILFTLGWVLITSSEKDLMGEHISNDIGFLSGIYTIVEGMKLIDRKE